MTGLCPVCDGAGEVPVPVDQDEFGNIHVEYEDCSRCAWTGEDAKLRAAEEVADEYGWRAVRGRWAA